MTILNGKQENPEKEKVEKGQLWKGKKLRKVNSETEKLKNEKSRKQTSDKGQI